MGKPSGADYLVAFQNPWSAFAEPMLQQAQPSKNRLGLPKLMSGNFAVVCHFSGARETWAVRAFIKDVPDLQLRYQLISAYLDGHRGDQSPFVGFRYVPDGIRVNGQLHPIVVMDWVPGVQLDAAIGQRLRDGEPLHPLIESWNRLVIEMEAMQVAHGDLQHGNILVSGDQIRLVDYDGMFVPGMAGMPFSEQGHANYQHPERLRHGFNSSADRFSATLILTAMRALEHDSSLWQRTRMPNDHVLFRKEDLTDPARSALFTELITSPDPEVRMLAGLLRDSLMTGNLPPLLTQLAVGHSTVVRTTTDTAGWWKTGKVSPENAEGSPSQAAHERIGAGWIRAYLGANVAGAQQANTSASQSPAVSASHTHPILEQVPFVASFNRPYVHRSTCDWARQITGRNLIGFATLDEALASGYKPCKTCKPHQLSQDLFLAGEPTVGSAAASGAPGMSHKLWSTEKVREHIQAAAAAATSSSPNHHRPHRRAVSIGSQVKVQYGNGSAVLIRLVKAGNPTPTPSHVAENTPLARALIGKYPGQNVVYREMGKVYKCTIVEVL